VLCRAKACRSFRGQSFEAAGFPSLDGQYSSDGFAAVPDSLKIYKKSPQRENSRLSREQRAAEILLHARAVFCEKGYGNTLVSEIAERAGVVEGSVFHYFPTKRELLIKTVEQWYTGLIWDYDHRLESITGTWNRLRFMVWGHLHVIHEEPEMIRLIFDEIRPGPEYRETAIFELNRQYTKRTLGIIDEAVAAGEFRAGVPATVIRAMIYGGVEHYAFAFLRGEGDFSPDEAADSIADIIYRGLANEGISRANDLREPIRLIEDGLEQLRNLAQPEGGHGRDHADQIDELIVLARGSFNKAAKAAVLENDNLGVPTHGAIKGEMVIRTPPKSNKPDRA
jgi:AcrR family transcriptional regulator